MLELVIAIVVALVVGLLIGITSMSRKTRDLETKVAEMQIADEVFADRVYNDLNFQINLLRCTVFTLENWPHQIPSSIDNYQRKRLRRLGAKLLRIKDKDEDHPDSVERQ